MKYIVDVNLPKKFSFFNNPNFEFVADIELTLSDSDIWKYALENDLVILTKDSDFYHRSILAKLRPKIVYFELGNRTLKQLHEYFTTNWPKIVNSLLNADLIVATRNTVDELI
jgi:predicted nuclease of predicted toxin-antitoxin system